MQDSLSAGSRCSRRGLIGAVAGSFVLAGAERSGAADSARPPAKARTRARLLFTSQGRTAAIDTRPGGQPEWLDFDVPLQETWQPAGFLSDGRILFLSMERRRDGPGKPFDEYYSQTPTHLWLYHPDSRALQEICTRDRLAVFVTPALVLSDQRLLVQVIRGRVGQLYSVNLDGSDAREFTKAGEGLPYGLSLSPDGRRVAFHLASPQGYQVWTSDLEGGSRVKVAGQPDHLYFGPCWSPDGKWLAYADCLYKQDPAHDWCDVCIARSDGSEQRLLTQGQAMWFTATYGGPGAHGGGSNLLAWTPDGRLLFPRRSPGAKVPWEFQPHRQDVDHFNRDFKPENARGGTQICRLDPLTGRTEELTPLVPGQWDFRAAPSPDGRRLAFCRALTGESPGLYVAEAKPGARPRLLTRGYHDLGADHPRWVPT
jgi:Tol biopolymer transport system component